MRCQCRLRFSGAGLDSGLDAFRFLFRFQYVQAFRYGLMYTYRSRSGSVKVQICSGSCLGSCLGYSSRLMFGFGFMFVRVQIQKLGACHLSLFGDLCPFLSNKIINMGVILTYCLNFSQREVAYKQLLFHILISRLADCKKI